MDLNESVTMSCSTQQYVNLEEAVVQMMRLKPVACTRTVLTMNTDTT